MSASCHAGAARKFPANSRLLNVSVEHKAAERIVNADLAGHE